jgi:hypothetical protein
MGRNLAAPAIIGRAPTSNGFARRKIIDTTGAYSFALPTDVTECDVAVFGGGGSGVLVAADNNNYVTPGGGAGGGFARKRFRNINGGTISGVVGLGGPAPSGANPNSTITSVAGVAGGTSTAVFSGSTLTATGGAGASLTPGAPATGGVGSGGDASAAGGRGGATLTSEANSHANRGPAGGGASGSPFGTGGDGTPAISTVLSPGYLANGAGGAWGNNAPILAAAAQGTVVLCGGTPLGAGEGAAMFSNPASSIFLAPFGTGTMRVMTGPSGSTYINEADVPILTPWWDIEDLYSTSPSGWYQQSSGLIIPWPGGLGAGASTRSGDPTSVTCAKAGFGGGGPGYRVADSARNIPFGALPGVGGGSGGFLSPRQSSPTIPATLYGIPGGNGCVIIWY